jgi:hypothetical protein
MSADTEVKVLSEGVLTQARHTQPSDGSARLVLSNISDDRMCVVTYTVKKPAAG